MILLPSDVTKCVRARVLHPSDYAAGTLESGCTVIMDLAPGIIQYIRIDTVQASRLFEVCSVLINLLSSTTATNGI